MISVEEAVQRVLLRQRRTQKPLAVFVAGHNGSGKSTMWYRQLVKTLQIPLINADRMMMSILPETAKDKSLPGWAIAIRDKDSSWMRVSQRGVESFVAAAMAHHVPFAMETVFSYWQARDDGTFSSKIDKIHELQSAGYFVLLLFVGLANVGLSIGRVQTRVNSGGHDVPVNKLIDRFPRTQNAIREAAVQADATILMDNSRSLRQAFTTCRVQAGREVLFDCRDGRRTPPSQISAWLDIVSPRPTPASS